MYQSGIRITNGKTTLRLDALSGEILAYIDERRTDNVCKNHVRECFTPLDGILLIDGKEMRFFPPRYMDIRRDETLRPVIKTTEAEAEIFYPFLLTAAGKQAVSARIHIVLPANDERVKWNLTLENHTGHLVEKVNFPSLTGMWLGETWEDDRLLLPRFAGWETVNPSLKLGMTPPTIQWKWQEYLYQYNLGEMNGALDDRSAYTVELPYSGAASMLWMELYDPNENCGLYMTCRNEKLRMKALRADSMGGSRPGIGMAIVHKPCLFEGVWHSEECITALHQGDWHWGAKEYAQWFKTLKRPAQSSHIPEWFKKSPGLMAHYDFQYQLGGIVHTFRDIPRLMQEAMDMGFNHLLLSGWHEDGFDYGFPHYQPNHLLGTEEDLKNAVAEAKRMGGHIAFYVNARLCNTLFEDTKERVEKSAIRNQDGSVRVERYGSGEAPFALLCINDEEWQQTLRETVRYLTHDIGADGMYLDQLAMAESTFCFHPGHTNHAGDPAAWNGGYDKLLTAMRSDYKEEGMGLIFEGCNDAFGPYASGQLITTLGGPFVGRKPEMYRYTFPDQILCDMMNPRRWSAMRPEHVARHATEWLYLAFVNGMYLWCYDLEGDNNFRSDDAERKILMETAALRKRWLNAFGHGIFRDEEGIVQKPEKVFARRYDVESGALIALGAEQGMKGHIRFRADRALEGKAVCLTVQGEEVVLPVEKTGDEYIITLPEKNLCLICLK
ncbi:MAG: hypothetical protein IKT57_08845 [Clostridia bacterium]|nr:hypothetical protein [Clostridia bacterium]